MLIFCSLRSVGRTPVSGAAGYAIHGFQIAAGATLCLLTLLGLGGRDVSFKVGDDPLRGELQFSNKMYPLAAKDLSVAVVFIVYAVVIIGSFVSRSIRSVTRS